MTRPIVRPSRREELHKRAIRLAAVAIMLRDGHELTSLKVAEMFDVTVRHGRNLLQDASEIVPTYVSRPASERSWGRPCDVYRALRKDEL